MHNATRHMHAYNAGLIMWMEYEELDPSADMNIPLMESELR